MRVNASHRICSYVSVRIWSIHATVESPVFLDAGEVTHEQHRIRFVKSMHPAPIYQPLIFITRHAEVTPEYDSKDGIVRIRFI